MLHRIYPQVSDRCWRCHQEEGTAIHIWWGCPKVNVFWEKILKICSKITLSCYSNSPELALLSVIPGSISSIKKNILRHALTAGRAVIPRHWRSDHAPSIAEWVAEMNSIMRMEELVAEDRGNNEKFNITWMGWLNFRSPENLKEFL